MRPVAVPDAPSNLGQRPPAPDELAADPYELTDTLVAAFADRTHS